MAIIIMIAVATIIIKIIIIMIIIMKHFSLHFLNYEHSKK